MHFWIETENKDGKRGWFHREQSTMIHNGQPCLVALEEDAVESRPTEQRTGSHRKDEARSSLGNFGVSQDVSYEVANNRAG